MSRLVGPMIGNIRSPLPRRTPPQKASATAMMPHPTTIAKQKAQYIRLIDMRLTGATDAVTRQMQSKLHMLRTMAEQAKAEYAMRVNWHLAYSELKRIQQYQRDVARMQVHTQTQKLMLEERVLQLKYGGIEYQFVEIREVPQLRKVSSARMDTNSSQHTGLHQRTRQTRVERQAIEEEQQCKSVDSNDDEKSVKDYQSFVLEFSNFDIHEVLSALPD